MGDKRSGQSVVWDTPERGGGTGARTSVGVVGILGALLFVGIGREAVVGELPPLAIVASVAGLLMLATSRYLAVVPLAVYSVLAADEASNLLAPGGERLMKWLGVGAVALLLLRTAARRSLRLPPAWMWPFVLLGGWAATTLTWSIDLSASEDGLTTLLGLLLTTMALSMCTLSDEELALLRETIIAGGVLVSAVALLLYLDQLSSTDWDVTRGLPRLSGVVPWGNWANPNTLSVSLFLPIALSLAVIGGARSVGRRTWGAIALAGMLMAILVSQSRAAILGVVVILVLLSGRLRNRLLPAALVIGVVGFFAWDVLLALVERFSPEELMPKAGRTNIWEYALEAFGQFWLAGSGIGTFKLTFSELGLGAGRFAGSDAHSIYIQLGVELGVVGVILFLVAMGSLLRALRRAREGAGGPVPPDCLWTTMVGFLVYALSHGILREKFFWLPIGLAAVALASERRAERHVEMAAVPAEVAR